MKVKWKNDKEESTKSVKTNGYFKKTLKILINLIIIALLLLGVVSTNKQKSVDKNKYLR